MVLYICYPIQANQLLFLKAEGIELMVLTIKEGRYASRGALRVMLLLLCCCSAAPVLVVVVLMELLLCRPRCSMRRLCATAQTANVSLTYAGLRRCVKYLINYLMNYLMNYYLMNYLMNYLINYSINSELFNEEWGIRLIL